MLGEIPNIVRAPISPDVRVYNGDYNGTLGPIGRPPSSAMVRTLMEWVAVGNVIDFNSSDNLPQGNPKFGNLVNGTRVGELGVAGYDFNRRLVIFHPLAPETELTKITDVIVDPNVEFRSAAYLPRYDQGDSHGVIMYIDQRETDDGIRALRRYPQIDEITGDREEFARFLHKHQGLVGMVTFQAYQQNRAALLENLSPLQTSQDTGGSVFVTPAGVTKAETLYALYDTVYKRTPDDKLIIGGDSPGTDGSLFGMPGVTKIAVGDSTLIQREVPGKVHLVKSPEGARRVLVNYLR